MIKTAKPEQEPPSGVQCPNCGCSHAPVYYTRQRLNKTVRVRQCRNCNRRFSTTERVTG